MSRLGKFHIWRYRPTGTWMVTRDFYLLGVFDTWRAAMDWVIGDIRGTNHEGISWVAPKSGSGRSAILVT